MNQVTLKGIFFGRKTATAIPRGAPVKLDSTNPEFVVTTTTANDPAIIGVTLEDSVAGGTVDVCFYGVAPVRIATASGVVVGDLLMSSTTAGSAVEIGATAGTNYNAFAKVLTAPSADGDLVSCLIGTSRAQG